MMYRGRIPSNKLSNKFSTRVRAGVASYLVRERQLKLDRSFVKRFDGELRERWFILRIRIS